ncbi:unnamed protein product [Rhizopus stolonifer]
MTPLIYFKSQFPDGTIEEISRARYCTEKKKYVDFGWSLYRVNIKSTKDNRRVHFKERLGSVHCTNSECRFFRSCSHTFIYYPRHLCARRLLSTEGVFQFLMPSPTTGY